MRIGSAALGFASLVIACSPAAAPPAGAPATKPPASATASAEPPVAPPPARDVNAELAAVAARFVTGYLQRAPTVATNAGNHAFDGAWPDVSAAGDADYLAFVATTRAELAKIPRAELGEQEQIDAKILESELDHGVFVLQEQRPADNNPLFYTGLVGDGFDPLLTRDFAPHAERMKSVRARLAGVPAIVAVAKKRLAHAPRLHTETAIAQNKGLIEVCEKGLAEDAAKEPDQKADLEAAAKAAAAALRDFQTFLEKDLLARSDGDFRVGREMFAKTMRFELDDDVAVDDLAKGARELLTRTQEEMVDTAMELAPSLLKTKTTARPTTAADKKKLVRAVLGALAAERPTNKTILADAKRELEKATAFVREHDLVRVPDEPCQVIEMPEYRRGVSIAYCDSSGPLEQKPWSVYAISPTPRDWSAKRAESFYREYNSSMLADLTAHEAMPGHYLQAMHANKGKRELRALFASGPFVEGWAVYGEWLMAKYGFGGPRVRLQRQKMTLRLAANAILDHDIHAGTMTEKEALALMTDEAFQEEGEAVGKWNRARLSAAQLTTYYYGFTELLKLRTQLERAPGFTERAYHDKLLGFGSPSIRHIRSLMTKGL
jgi:uncharacterized protein (DUF885 family)